MDFWAQHKEFVLKVLAGLGIFLVALIARGVTFGDDLKVERAANKTLELEIKKLKVPPPAVTRTLEENARKLKENANQLIEQIGFNGSKDDFELNLIRRTLGYLRRYKDAPADQIARDADGYWADIRANLNGGFGHLRLNVRDELRDEAGEMAIELADVGYGSVTNIESPDELRMYLLQLELVARLVRSMIDARVSLIEEMRITTKADTPIQDVNEEFLQEYAVSATFLCPQAAARRVYNELATRTPMVPWRTFQVQQVKRLKDHVRVELVAMALSANPEVELQKPEEENAQ